MYDTRLLELPHAMRERVLFVWESLHVYGFVNHAHLQRRFGVSTPTATSTLAACTALFPDHVSYNRELQCFVGTQTDFTVGVPHLIRSLVMPAPDCESAGDGEGNTTSLTEEELRYTRGSETEHDG